ncbi:inositol phospholipid synthesis and fat-storage-inducing TM-domain-containing protein [Fimicolochytrium jonesii]|uniref:inositol phospholipid synthesis and fat-storage-inducing TM-domain-containing protein n=1 Tax=Fimicolochytrium jonesii TaxID=1396493 RepID=UPI0022FE00EC|nr:inositol phospholipid synthesis and fat-storage-inducing TM-domain-containing protein [Fimicolochytrium jonesii]KAI8815630.1 inositol phospholipid synthesis and fat-storage-inducing TM-domain-containing protein [Fimicolochytrium jonesii]
MQKYQRNLALVYPLTVAIGSAVHTTIQVPYTIFANRRNPLNTVFAKRGWFWTGTTLFLFLLLSSTDRKRAPIIRWALATLYWVIFAQWAFGHSVFDRVLTMSGTCSIEEHGHPAICRKNGGEWLGFDVSGHCFLLIHMSLFIFEELQILIAPSASTSTTSSQQKPTPDAVDYSTDTSVSSTDGATLPSIPVTPSTTPLTTLRSRLPHPTSTAILSSILIFLLMLWYCMLIATSLYFHSWQEKVTGTVAGMAYWVVMYVMVWPKWFPGMAPGLPKGKEIYGGSGIGGGKKRAAAMRGVKRQ